MNRKLLLCCALTTMIFTTVHSQSFEGTLTKAGKSRSWGEIIQGDVIQGYYFFTPIDKASKKMLSYEITLLDNNLNKSASFTVDRPESYLIYEASFNNEAFVFNFYDTKSKTMEFVSFDRTGKQIGSIKTDKISKIEMAYINMWLTNPETENMSIYPLGTDGFMRYGLVDGKKDGFTVGAYSNELKEKWSYTSDLNDELIEAAEILAFDENYIAMFIVKRPKLMSAKDMTTNLCLLDAKTGKEVYNFEWKDNTEGQLSVLSAFMLEKGELLILGEYYLPGVDATKEKSAGLYAQEVEITGEYKVFKKYSWDRDIASHKGGSQAEDESAKDKGKNLLYFHHIVRSRDGKIFVIAEEYKKQASALGIAATALSAAGGGSSGTSTMEIRLGKMVTIELDKDLNMIGYTSVDKKMSRIKLPGGYGTVSPQRLGAYLKMIGGFDYEFTSKNREKDTYHSIYRDGDRSEEGSKDKAKVMVGTLNIVNGAFSNERIPLNSDADVIRLYNAKPGYIGIYEYTNKTKKLKFRLEKVLN